MRVFKNAAVICTLALAISACGTNPSQDNNSVRIETVGTQSDSQPLWGNLWDWVWGTGSSSPAPNVTERPSDRPKVICDLWCPRGYTRRGASIGPDCDWWIIGKCVDNTAYRGEGCGYGGKECVPGLECVEATAEETETNAHPEACH